MTLQDLGNIGEFVGAIGVIASLVYLAVQIRQNTTSVRASTFQKQAIAMTLRFFASSELSAVLAKLKAVDGLQPIPQALVGRYDLTPEEALLWERHLALVWMGLEANYSLSGESQELESRIRFLLTFPDNQLYWEHGIPVAGADFGEYVKGVRELR